MKSNRMLPGAVLAMTALALAGTAARAGALDRALMHRYQTSRILYYLEDRKYRNVGILPFKVQKGARAASYSAAPLTSRLPARLENALVLAIDPRSPRLLGIIHNAGDEAAAARVGAFRTSKAAFDRLFATTYPLAWSRTRVSADAFLTGTVINGGADRGRTRVVIEVFDRKSFDTRKGQVVTRKVHEFTVETDRPLLTDLAYNYAIPPRALARGISIRDRNRMAVRAVARQDTGEGNGEVTPENIPPGFAFELQYNEEPQVFTRLSGGDSTRRAVEYQVPTAPPGANIKMFLTRKVSDDRTYGVILKVNGESTLEMERADSIHCRKWLYPPRSVNRRDRWEGFYLGLEGKNLKPFRSLTPDESAAKAAELEQAPELASRIGWIDVEIFASASSNTGNGDSNDATTMLFTTAASPRGLKPGLSLTAYQSRLQKVNHIKRVKKRLVLGAAARARDLIVPDEADPIEGERISEGEALANPEPVAHLAIRYYEATPGRTVTPKD